MNIDKLKGLERDFLLRYPGGFKNDELQKISKKHNLEKNNKNILDVCSPENLQKGSRIYSDVIKVATRSSLVSVFEKMRLRDLGNDLDKYEKIEFVQAIYELLHGKQKEGFYRLVSILKPYKLAKWPIITVYLSYYYPNREVFIKPTVVKKVINYLELYDIRYPVTPDYKFYKKYKKYINEMKKEVHKSLRPNNPAFTGFLMITIGRWIKWNIKLLS